MQINLKKEERYQRIERALKSNLKKRKIFQEKIKNKNKSKNNK
tara:strand:+ start:371 stop:499 length:129 start_codon:yes stop_codon:yes gene_type:complete